MIEITKILIPTKLSDIRQIWRRCRQHLRYRRMIEEGKKKGYIRIGARYYHMDKNGCIGFELKEDELPSVFPSRKCGESQG